MITNINTTKILLLFSIAKIRISIKNQNFPIISTILKLQMRIKYRVVIVVRTNLRRYWRKIGLRVRRLVLGSMGKSYYSHLQQQWQGAISSSKKIRNQLIIVGKIMRRCSHIHKSSSSNSSNNSRNVVNLENHNNLCRILWQLIQYLLIGILVLIIATDMRL